MWIGLSRVDRGALPRRRAVVLALVPTLQLCASAASLSAACGTSGVAPAPHLLVEARATRAERATNELRQRRQHYSLTAALAVPIESSKIVPMAAHGAGRLHELPPTEPIARELMTPVSQGDEHYALATLLEQSRPKESASAATPGSDAQPTKQTEQTTPARARTTPASAIRRKADDLAFDDAFEPNLSEVDPETARRLLQRYAREPSAQAVVREAQRIAMRDPQRLSSLLSRARWKGLIPDLTLGARRGQGVDLRTMVTQDESVRFTTGDDLVLSATLRFELGRLLFAPEEIAVAREARAARAAWRDVVRDIVHWYALRRRLMLERDLLGHTSITRESRIMELEALLDVFTDGAFGRMIAGQAAWTTTGASTPVSEPP